MLPNGMIITIDRAVGDAFVTDDESAYLYGMWVHGIMREDVVLLRGFGKANPSPSLGHIYPWFYHYFMRLYRGAVRRIQKGDISGGHFRFGRAMHVLIDVACPSHSLPVWHCWRDPFERYVESHASELVQLPLPELSSGITGDPKQLLHSLVSESRRERGDYTQSPLGRWMRRRGWRSKPDAAQLRQQVTRLMPLAAAHLRALIQCFERDTGLNLLPTTIVHDENPAALNQGIV